MNAHKFPAASPVPQAGYPRAVTSEASVEARGFASQFELCEGAYHPECDECDGRGEIGGYLRVAGEGNDFEPWSTHCSACAGEGELPEWVCPTCDCELTRNACLSCAVIYQDAELVEELAARALHVAAMKSEIRL